MDGLNMYIRDAEWQCAKTNKLLKHTYELRIK